MWNILIPSIFGILDKVLPDTNAAVAAKAKLLEMQVAGELDTIKGQLEINKEEAKHSSIFVAGWRPFIGWVCGISFAYQFLLQPIAGGFGYKFPTVDAEALMTLLFALLGIAGYRTVEKIKKVA